MKDTFTQDFLSLERESRYLLELFEKLPDDSFSSPKNSLGLVVKKLKAFARVYQNFSFDGQDSGFVIN